MNFAANISSFIFPVKHQSDAIIIPVASHLLGPYESSFRTFDATDYQPIGKFDFLMNSAFTGKTLLSEH